MDPHKPTPLEIVEEMVPEKPSFSTAEVAELYGCLPAQVLEFVDSRDLVAFQNRHRTKGSRIRVPRPALVAFLLERIR
jgi:hypothetical protein